MTLRQFVAFVLLASSSSVARADDPKRDILDGVWLPSAAGLGGKKFPDEIRKSIRLEVKGDRYTVTAGAETDRGTCKLDPSAKPKAPDITGTEGPTRARPSWPSTSGTATRYGSATI